VKTSTENIEAELVNANDDFVILSWKAREPKKLGKGRKQFKKELTLPYVDIKSKLLQ
jgi:ribosome maturation factor RimP